MKQQKRLRLQLKRLAESNGHFGGMCFVSSLFVQLENLSMIKCSVEPVCLLQKMKLLAPRQQRPCLPCSQPSQFRLGTKQILNTYNYSNPKKSINCRQSLVAAISIFYQLNATLNVHSLYKYLLSTYYVQVLFQAQENTAVDKTQKKCPYSNRRTEHTPTNKKCKIPKVVSPKKNIKTQ